MSIRIGDRIISGSGGAADGESLINQNTSSSIEKVYNWVGTIAEYEEQDVANIHPDWVCYIIDDETGDDEEYEVYEISGRNVGDIFFTSRKDLNLNGAVECDGGVYNLSDYTGVESIEELLKSNKLPYVSISEYNTLLETNGSVGVFGWDGDSASTFKVPTLNEVFIESGKVSNLGEFIKPGLPNITGVAGGDEFPHTIEIAEGVFYNAGRAYDGTAGSQYESYKLGFDASRSNSIYGSSDTVQPQSVCYRPMVQLATGIKEESIYNIENHALFDNRITNCITHIPQDIKLELNNETLTLKAGSKVYVPNGVGVFDEITFANDISIYVGTGSYTKMIFIKSDGTVDTRTTPTTCYSGSSAPSGQINMAWYDTSNNLVKLTSDSGSTWTSGYSLPIGVFTMVSDVPTFIDQIFNGFGYIGSTVFVLPGVKGLIPDGRNADGSLKNTTTNDFTTVKTVQVNTSTAKIAMYSGGGIGAQTKNFGLNEPENYNYDTGFLTNALEVARVIVDSSAKITAFTPKNAFHAVDYNETEFIANQAMPSDKYIDLTLGASGTSYIAPADGWFYLSKFCIASSSTAGNHSIIMRVFDKDDNVVYIYQDWCNAAATTQVMDINTPVKKGAKVRVEYSLTGATSRFRFIYTEGAK